MYSFLTQPFYSNMPINLENLFAYLTELETKVAFQEQALDELNQALIDQQFALDKVQQTVRFLAERLQGLQPSNIASRDEETPPPHY